MSQTCDKSAPPREHAAMTGPHATVSRRCSGSVSAAAEQAAENQLARFTQGASAALNQILLDIDLRLAEAGAALRQGPGVPAQADALLRGVTRGALEAV